MKEDEGKASGTRAMLTAVLNQSRGRVRLDMPEYLPKLYFFFVAMSRLFEAVSDSSLTWLIIFTAHGFKSFSESPDSSSNVLPHTVAVLNRIIYSFC